MGTAKLDINELLLATRRIKAEWLGWLADSPPDGDYYAEMLRTFVANLDAHGSFYIQSVSDEASCKKFMLDIRKIGHRILMEGAHGKISRRLIEAIGGAPATELGGPFLPGMLGDATFRFEARYAHWDAEALAVLQTGKTKPKRNAGRTPEFPARAEWLKAQLKGRGWSKHDLARYGGPDVKTTQQVLDGFAVREDVLEKIATALSAKGGTVKLTEVPNV